MTDLDRVRTLLSTDERPWIGAALIVAVVATSGSLFYSLGPWKLLPCRLCWYQRILMYPQIVVLGYGLLTRKPDIYRAVLALSLPGLAIAAYHSWLQMSPSLSCSFFGCGAVQYRFLGVLTIPNQSLLGFAMISVAMLGLFAAGPDR